MSESVSFTQEQIDVICCVEQKFWETGFIPTNEQIHELTGVSLTSVKGYWELKHIRDALVAKGVDLSPKSSGLLTVQQLHLANMLLNYHDETSQREKLQKAGVSSQQYHAWMRQDAFRNYLTKRAEEMWKSSDIDAYQGLANALRGGDMRAIQFHFEMRGIYNPRLQVDVNINLVVTRVIEIVQRHVKDPQILLAIADEIESLNTGTVTDAGEVIRQLPAALIDLQPIPEPSNSFVL